MSEIDDGGPAFPNTKQHDGHGDLLAHAESGMSLRDYFAGQALVGMSAEYGLSYLAEVAEKAAKEAFILADAMIEARASSSKTKAKPEDK